MHRFLQPVAILGPFLVVGLAANAAWAQPGAITPRGVPGYTTPPVSPYINLLRQGSPAAVNYYGIVRPEFQFQNALQNLQQQVTTLGSTAAPEAGPNALPATGHSVTFMNYSHYFGGLAAASSAGRAAPAASTSAAAAPASRAATAPAGPSPSRGAGAH
jgi:hypothetical protein